MRPTTFSRSLSKTLAAGLRLALALGIICYLFRQIDLQALAAILSESLNHWPWMLVGVLLGYLGLHFGALRWQVILDTQGLALSWKRCFQIYFIGQFFNALMFGATGGDLVRAIYAARETHHQKIEAVVTVFIDRLIGLIVLYLIAAVMLAARTRFFVERGENHVPALIVLGMIAATALGLALVFNLHRFAHWPLADRIMRHPALGRTIRRVLTSLRLYRRRTAILARISLLSLAIQVLAVIQFACIGWCLQINLSFWDYLTVVPIIIAIAAIPVTPGGLGIREGAAVTLFSALGVPGAQALPLSLMVYFISVGWSLVGGVIFMGYSSGSGHPVREEMLEIERQTAGKDGQEWIPGAHE